MQFLSRQLLNQDVSEKMISLLVWSCSFCYEPSLAAGKVSLEVWIKAPATANLVCPLWSHLNIFYWFATFCNYNSKMLEPLQHFQTDITLAHTPRLSHPPALSTISKQTRAGQNCNEVGSTNCPWKQANEERTMGTMTWWHCITISLNFGRIPCKSFRDLFGTTDDPGISRCEGVASKIPEQLLGEVRIFQILNKGTAASAGCEK